MIPLRTQHDPSTAPHSGLWTSASKSRSGQNVPLFAGELIAGRYQVSALVGEGGMGFVYRCRDRSNDAEVAVKCPILDVADEGVTHDCLMAETRALARLRHDNIVTARSSGADASGVPYLVMDWVTGVTLDRAPACELEYPLVWSLIDQVLGALSHAHARGIVHGDVKPANVMLEATPTGPRVRLLDFGLAWHFGAGADRELVWSPPCGAGTVGYMAPEQTLGDAEAIGPCTDLYSVGCLAHRLLTGKSPGPWSLRSPCGQNAPVPFHLPVPARMDLPARTMHFIMRLLSYNPTDRASSTADARAEWADHRPTGPRPTHQPRFPTIAALAGW